MIVEARSHFEQPSLPQTEDELTAFRHVQQWEQEGEMSPAAVMKSLDSDFGEVHGWSMGTINEQSIAGDTFAKLCNDDGLGLSLDKFTNFFQDMLDTQLPHVQTALKVIHRMLLFWVRFPFETHGAEAADKCMNREDFLRSLRLHAELNTFFNMPRVGQSLSSLSPLYQRNGIDGMKVVDGRPPRTAWDLRRVLFRTLASPIPGRHVEDSMQVPVIQFVSHEHTTNEDGADLLIEHRTFELEDERTTHLLDLIGIYSSSLKCSRLGFRTQLRFMRETFKTVPQVLPHVQHDLRQLGVEKAELVALITVLSSIDPFQEMVELIPDALAWQSKWQQLNGYLAQSGDIVEWEAFDELIQLHVPHFYVQLSKVIGMLVSGRPAQEDTELELHQDWKWGSYRAGEHLPTSLDVFTADQRFRSRELPEALFVNSEVEKPLWHCLKCRDDFGMEGYHADYPHYLDKEQLELGLIFSKARKPRRARRAPRATPDVQTRTIMTRSRTGVKGTQH